MWVLWYDKRRLLLAAASKCCWLALFVANEPSAFGRASYKKEREREIHLARHSSSTNNQHNPPLLKGKISPFSFGQTPVCVCVCNTLDKVRLARSHVEMKEKFIKIEMPIFLRKKQKKVTFTWCNWEIPAQLHLYMQYGDYFFFFSGEILSNFFLLIVDTA